jgi:hypothetical protein
VVESQSERSDRYLKMAADLRREADRAAEPKLAASYLELARVWLKLAEEVRPLGASGEERGRSNDQTLDA